MSENNTKKAIKQAVIDAVNDSKDEIINQIANQKRTMFDDNSHAWSPLLPQTIARKNENRIYSDRLRVSIFAKVICLRLLLIQVAIK